MVDKTRAYHGTALYIFLLYNTWRALRLHRGKLKSIVMQRLRDLKGEKKAFLTLYSDFVSLASAFHPELLFFTSSFLISFFTPFSVVCSQQPSCKLSSSLPQAKINSQAMCRNTGGRSVTCSACAI